MISPHVFHQNNTKNKRKDTNPTRMNILISSKVYVKEETLKDKCRKQYRPTEEYLNIFDLL